ncbi:uncharacterized protein LOC144877847 isoform X1 [Branchiostoma floridae x Branchiostoma japonicum]
MKGLVFVIAVAFACCVATCGALQQCRECFANTLEECKQEPLSNCSSGHTQCMSISIKVLGESKLISFCSGEALCGIGIAINHYSCNLADNDYMCIGCCPEPGCITEDDFTIGGAARASIATMATTTLTVLLTIAMAMGF